MSPTLRLVACGLPLVFVACASSPYPSVNDPMPPPEAGPAAAPKPESAQSREARRLLAQGTLKRADVESVVDGGLGRFLAHVALEPHLSAGKFTGWSIVGLQPPELWSAIDLRPGDVVTQVNGMSIEREMQAFDAFQAVRQAPALEISYLRRNQPRTLRLNIVGPPSPSLPQAPPAEKGPG